MKIEGFKIIGISTRMINDEKAGEIIGGMWAKFMGEGVIEKIPNKLSFDVYSIYTDYEGDHTQPYTTILGCKVSNLDNIPNGMIGKEFKGGKYTKFTSKGNLNEGVVFNTWMDIWQSDLKRDYVFDFELYGEKAQNPTDAEVDIYVGLS